MAKIKLKARINKANGQVNFQLKKTSFPKRHKHKIPRIKEINLDFEDFEFEEW